MKRNVTALTLCAWFALCVPIEAQQANYGPVIGFFRSGSASSVAPEREAFLQALKDLGYIDGKNIRIEYRYADGNPNDGPTLLKIWCATKLTF